MRVYTPNDDIVLEILQPPSTFSDNTTKPLNLSLFNSYPTADGWFGQYKMMQKTLKMSETLACG